MRVPGLGLIVATALLLGGCNNFVHSSRPWFTEADARQAPAVRSGWWVVSDPLCRFSSAEAPSSTWPKCVTRFLLPPGDRLILQGNESTRFEYLLAPGQPLIVQGLTPGDDRAEPPRADEYGYLGLQPRQRDPQGRITAFDLWFVLCGPPRRTHGEPSPIDRTDRPWPGLVIEDEAAGCTARDVEALRGAARRSKRSGALSADHNLVRWIRDWRPGDQTREEWLAALADPPH